MRNGLEPAISAFRAKIREAKAELRTCRDRELRRYLKARIAQAHMEANAMRRSMLEMEVTKAERRWS